MKNILDCKEWSTLGEAAQRLAKEFDQEVVEADVLRLALDRGLKLSVRFMNHAQAQCGTFSSTQHNDAEMEEPLESGEMPEFIKWGINSDLLADPLTYMASEHADANRRLDLHEEIVPITGVWDLSLIGGGRLVLERKYQNLTSGQDVTLECMGGIVVEQSDKVCVLQNRFKLMAATFDLASDGSEPIAGGPQTGKKIFKGGSYPADGLPPDSEIVVRTAAIREFIEANSHPSANSDKQMTTTERNTLLTIIAALCDHSAINHQERGTAGMIAQLTDEIGASVTDDTIRKVLKKIPEALEARMKDSKDTLPNSVF